MKEVNRMRHFEMKIRSTRKKYKNVVAYKLKKKNFDDEVSQSSNAYQ